MVPFYFWPQNQLIIFKGCKSHISFDLIQPRYAELKEIPLNQCKRKYNTFLKNNRKKAHLTDNQLCAGNNQVGRRRR